MSDVSHVSEMRTPYRSTTDTFDVDDLVARNPYKQFESWFNEACHTPGIAEANAMALATSTKDGIPAVRMVLMKGFDHHGFKFFTNYESRKSAELTENPRCCLMFYWEPLKRSVRIEGNAFKLTDEESNDYFHSRPRPSQLGAICSHQSTVIPTREVLSKRYNELEEEFKDEEKIIPKPSYWGGYRVIPDSFEFWQGQTNRLHDRLKFRKMKNDEIVDKNLTHEGEDGWVFERLSP